MNALQLLRFLTEAPFLVIFLIVLRNAIQQPRLLNIHVAMFFGALALIIATSWIADALDVADNQAVGIVVAGSLLALPYLQLQLVHDLSGIRPLIRRTAAAGMLVSIVPLAFLTEPYPTAYILAAVGLFVLVQGYITYRVINDARAAHALVKRRLEAFAFASGALAVLLVVIGMAEVSTGMTTLSEVLRELLALASGIGFGIAFAPPRLLRTAWRSGPVGRFLRESAAITNLRDDRELAARIQRNVEMAIGAGATLLIWNEGLQRLVAPSYGTRLQTPAPSFPRRVFDEGRPRFTDNALRDDPQNAAFYTQYDSIAMMAAPIEHSGKRLGVLVVFSARPSIFASDDLTFLGVLAQQVGLLLETRRLLEEAAVVRAEAEATRLKDDFLSAAAHDLKTPLTTLLGRAQLLERRALRDPQAPADLEGIRDLVREGQRMRTLVGDLLDASRSERTGFIGDRHPLALAPLVTDAANAFQSSLHTIDLQLDPDASAAVDPARIRQVIHNLIDNAIKYSPTGGCISITLHAIEGGVHLLVEDRGIGIPSADLAHIFERFRRGANADDRRFAGMGLGLYLCRQIVEEHGGRIWAESEPGEGSKLHILLPRDEGRTI